jgi:RimJ/RimL family protein N-acetyltransferase
MPFYPADAPVPLELRGEAFLLRPLTAADNPLDYEAVMATQETLRLRGNGDWPRGDFTLEENLVDLEEHEADFRDRRGFTYTVIEPGGNRCLGCLYIYPLVEALRRRGADEEAAQVSDRDAMVWFWVRPDAVANDIDRQLVTALIPWLRNEFAFPRIVFATWASDPRQTALLRESGLDLTWTRPVRDTEALHFE